MRESSSSGRIRDKAKKIQDVIDRRVVPLEIILAIYVTTSVMSVRSKSSQFGLEHILKGFTKVVQHARVV